MWEELQGNFLDCSYNFWGRFSEHFHCENQDRVDAEQVALPTAVVLTNMTIHKAVWNTTRTKIIRAQMSTMYKSI